MRLHSTVLICVCAASSAHASFEMLLVADNGSNTTATRRIHRFDPDSGVYLGAFGNFSADIKSMTIRQARNEAIVTAGANILVFDYNTGALKSSLTSTTFTDIAFSQDDQYFYGVTGGSTIWRMSTANFDSGGGGLSAWVTEATTTQISSIAVTTGGYVVTGQSRSGSLFEYFYTSSGSSNQATIYTAGATIGAAENVAGGGALQAYSFGGVGRLAKYNNSGLGSGSFASSGIGTATAVAAAHTGAYIVGIDAVTPTQGLISRFTDTGFEMQSFGGSVLRKPVAMSSVLAPEPEALFALGLGMVGLLARRRRR